MNYSNCLLIDDNSGKHQPYASEYRREGSGRFHDFSAFDPYNAEDILRFCDNLPAISSRGDLCRTLHEFNSQHGAGKKTLENIKTLEESNTYAVIAGHQPVLLGGQMFLLLKILSAIKLCNELNNNYKDKKFVPVFWNASEDHNLDEFTSCSVFDSNSDLHKISLNLPDAMKRTSAADSALYNIDDCIYELSEVLADTDFKTEVIAKLIDVSVKSGNLGEFFSRTILKFFDGIIILEPKILRGFNEHKELVYGALTDQEKLHTIFEDESANMEEAGFRRQLPPLAGNESLVFYIPEDGKRERIIRSGNKLSTPSGNFNADLTEIQSVINNEPERFSPSAALRPVIQSAILPAAVYIAGGGELSYHYQLRSVFCYFNKKIPLLLPRAAATILKTPHLKKLEKFSISPETLLASDWSWEKINESLSSELDNLNAAFNALKTQIDAADKDFSKALTRCAIMNHNEWHREKEKFYQRLEGLQKHYKAQNPLLGSEGKKQYYSLRKFIFPAEGFQDLHCWWLYFVALFGEGFINEVLKNLQPLSRKHHLFIMR